MSIVKDRIAHFTVIVLLMVWAAFVQDYYQAASGPAAVQAAQTYTDNVYDPSIVASTSLQAMEDNFAALKSSFSGSSSPPNPVAGMWWYDTTANILKLRNEANGAWLDVYDFANGYAIGCSNTVLAGTGISVSGSLKTGDVTVSATTTPYTAGTGLLVQSMDLSQIGDYTTYTTVRTIQIDRPGTLRISFRLDVTATTGLYSGSASCTSYGRIYRDRGGSVTAVGTVRSLSASVGSSDYQTYNATYSQDISGWQAGDKVLLRGYCVKSLSGSTPSGSGSISEIQLLTGNAYGLMVME